MYTFVKLRNEKYDIDYPWMLRCEDISTIKDHSIAYLKPVISEGMDDMLSSRDGSHLSTIWAYAMHLQFFYDEPISILEASTKLELELLEGKLNLIKEQGGIYLTDGPAYMPYSKELEVIDTIVKEDILFPTYTEEDIKIIKWNDGIHWYAKVGRMDIVDDEGNQKWNTKKEAEQKAKEFLFKLK